ncbi:Uncharacterized protein PECH_008130 [Penicillium ucsense]|uniref:Uncharacterized protein n=1 Tax=Penicillium ucsense TaxID=2839758 RepID=A0A8J8WKF6_9EURO|nr:Uncharacterized protein PECM_003317 [Penicillium ucsense]KAF7738759.1 Uncharacterized protein PECH_008130 [Penicillium ucsense]
METFPNPFCNLDLWCDWSGDPLDTVSVCMTVEVWCDPGSQITVMDTRHPLVEHFLEFTISPTENSEENDSARASCDSSGRHSEQYEDSKATPTPSARRGEEIPMTMKNKLPFTPETSPDHATLQFGSTETTYHVPDLSQVFRMDSTPDGSPGPDLDDIYATVLQGEPSPGHQTADGQSPSNPRKRTARAASLPDSVTDSERPYGGETLKNLQRAETRNRQSSASTSSSHSKLSHKSLIPRPMSLKTPHVQLDSSQVTNLATSVPALFATESDLSASDAVPDEKISQDGCAKIEQTCDSTQNSKDVSGSHASAIASAEFVSENDLGGARSSLNDMETLSTVASAGSSCDQTALSNPTYASIGKTPALNGEVPVRSDRVETSPPRMLASDQPILNLTEQILHINCSSNVRPSWYKVQAMFSLRLQTKQTRGWYSLVVPGLPDLSATDHGYVYLRIPDGQGLEFRSLHFQKYEIVQGCLIAQFRLIQSQLVIPLRPCDAQFYGFLRDFRVNHSISSRLLSGSGHFGAPIFEYTAICSLDLIHRDFWAEQCGFQIYIHGGPDGEFSCHLDTPLADFQVIQLDSKPQAQVGITQLQVICTLANLSFFVITWQTCLPEAEGASWTPRITATRDGYHVEEGLQARYFAAEYDEHEVVRAEPRSRLVTFKGTYYRSKPRSMLGWLVLFFVALAALTFFQAPVNIDLYNEFHRLKPVVEDWGTRLLNMGLPESRDPASAQTRQQTDTTDMSREVSEIVAKLGDEPLKAVHGPMHSEQDTTHPSPQAMSSQPQLDMRDRFDYLFGWRGPVNDGI